ncbi:MAG TPA: LLM class flavin-dependent oxidoreductase [Stellaceae bacterium]|nr:LLM class flavin-dependent oxidoreductase [Stellaceae bacterium]
MEFSTMVLTMYVAVEDTPEADERVLNVAVEESLFAAAHGFNPWFTEHHFRGPWHSNPIQFASFIAPQIAKERYLGFGVLSLPYYNPVRLVESMNQLDQLTKGHTLYGLGSGFAGIEPPGMGVDVEYHRSGRAAMDTLDVMRRLWDYRTGEPEFAFETGTHRGRVRKRVTPAPYRKRHPIAIRTASSNAAVARAAEIGLPAFLGTFAAESALDEQIRLYRAALAAAKHPPEVVAECLAWCTVDWLAVVVADTDAEALARAAEARDEHLAMRRDYVARFGTIVGPAIQRRHDGRPAGGYAAGGDMDDLIAGSPDTVAARVQELAQLGINHLLVRFLGEWPGQTRGISEDSMRLFAREILPRFKDSPPRSTSVR